MIKSLTPYQRNPRTRYRYRGLTLVELMLSIVVTSIVALAMTTIFTAVTNGTRTGDDQMQLRTRKIIIGERLATMIRGSKQVLATTDDTIVLWLGDSNQNSTPNLLEIARIHWDADNNQLSIAIAPADLDEADNTEYALSDDFNTITETLAGDPTFPTAIWSDRMESFSLTLDALTASEVRVIQLDITLTGNNGTAEAVTMVMGLRG